MCVQDDVVRVVKKYGHMIKNGSIREGMLFRGIMYIELFLVRCESVNFRHFYAHVSKPVIE